MARSKSIASGLTAESFEKVGLVKALELICNNGAEQIVMRDKNGATLAIKITYDKDAKTYNTTMEEGDGLFDNILLVKKGQDIVFDDNAITIKSTTDGSLLDIILSTVREKLDGVQDGLCFSENCHIAIAQKGKLAENELIPSTTDPADYAKLLQVKHKEYKLEEPNVAEHKVTRIDQSFQIVAPASRREMDFTGELVFSKSKVMLLITVDYIGNQPAVKGTHKMSVQTLKFDGTPANYLGKAVEFNLQMLDATIDKEQLVSNLITR